MSKNSDDKSKDSVMEKQHFFDKPRNFRKFLICFYGSLVVLVIVDYFIHRHKHGYFHFDEALSFYGTFGFVACVLLVLAAKYILRPLTKRKEDYYD